MGVDVNKLRPDQSYLRCGTTKVSMSFYGVVDYEADNPVKLKLFIEPTAQACFIDKGKPVKVLDTKKNFTPVLDSYTWEVNIEVTGSPDVPKSCSLRLEATDRLGNRSSVNSFFIYH